MRYIELWDSVLKARRNEVTGEEVIPVGVLHLTPEEAIAYGRSRIPAAIEASKKSLYSLVEDPDQFKVIAKSTWIPVEVLEKLSELPIKETQPSRQFKVEPLPDGAIPGTGVEDLKIGEPLPVVKRG